METLASKALLEIHAKKSSYPYLHIIIQNIFTLMFLGKVQMELWDDSLDRQIILKAWKNPLYSQVVLICECKKKRQNFKEYL